MKKISASLALLFFCLLASAQSSVTVLKDSLSFVRLRTYNKSLYLIQQNGGTQNRVDTGTGAFIPYAQSPLSPNTSLMPLSMASPELLFLQNRYLVWLDQYASPGNGWVASIGMNGVVDTLTPFFSNRFGSAECVQFLVDTTAWFSVANRLYHSSRLNTAALADSGEVGDVLGWRDILPGHGGAYYSLFTGTTAGQLQLRHHNGQTIRQIYTVNRQTTILKSLGMWNGDFYFVDYEPGDSSIHNKTASFRKVDTNGIVTTLRTLALGNRNFGDYPVLKDSLVWFSTTDYLNTLVPAELSVYNVVSDSLTAIPIFPIGSGNLSPFFTKGNFSPDGFFYFTMNVGNNGTLLGQGTDTAYRVKTDLSAPVERYGFYPKSLLNSRTFFQYYCNNKPMITSYDSLWIGTDSGFVFSGLNRNNQVAGGFGDWIQIDSNFYCLYGSSINFATTFRILKYTGCGIPQIQLGVAETQLVFPTAQTFPNPSCGNFQVRHEALNHEAKAQLFSIDGKLQSIQTATGVGVLEVISGNLPAGIYILKIQQGKDQFTQRVEVL